MSTDCLVLTPWMQPHLTVSWQEAVTLVYTKKGQPIEHYDAFVSSPSTTIQLPAVVRLKMMVATMKSDVKFSRINVYTRDGFRCQYCRVKKPMKGLNYDHVIPRSHGGKTSWENIVTSCIACNLKKDCMTPEQAGMRLMKRPVKPAKLPISGVFILKSSNVHALWTPYLQNGAAIEQAG